MKSIYIEAQPKKRLQDNRLVCLVHVTVDLQLPCTTSLSRNEHNTLGNSTAFWAALVDIFVPNLFLSLLQPFLDSNHGNPCHKNNKQSLGYLGVYQ